MRGHGRLYWLVLCLLVSKRWCSHWHQILLIKIKQWAKTAVFWNALLECLSKNSYPNQAYKNRPILIIAKSLSTSLYFSKSPQILVCCFSIILKLLKSRIWCYCSKSYIACSFPVQTSLVPSSFLHLLCQRTIYILPDMIGYDLIISILIIFFCFLFLFVEMFILDTSWFYLAFFHPR